MNEYQRNIAQLEDAISRIKIQAHKEGRKLSTQERNLCAEISEQIVDERLEMPQKPLTVGGLSSRASNSVFNSLGEQMKAVVEAGRTGGKVDPRLFNAATGLNETIPSEGGFLVEQGYSREILQDAFSEGDLAKRCRRQPVPANSNGIKINGVDETSRADGSRYGGVRSYWIAEAGEKQASKPKFRQIDLELKKNCVLIYATDEVLQDAVALDGYIRAVGPKEIAFTIDDCILNGTGAGMPMGILNAGCLVTVSKETGQNASTILAENVLKMYARTLGKSSNYIWLYSKSCIKELYSLSLAVGTGGVPLFMSAGSMPNQPENRLLGLPLVEMEQCSNLGTKGDLILADLKNGYILADKGQVRTDMSIHVQFLYDESVFRMIFRVDGQPVRASALTPYNGSDDQSHFIALETRS